MEQPIPWSLVLQHPMIILGSVLFVIAVLLASTGKFSKRDPALIYTFVASVVIIIMGFVSSFTNMRMAQATQPAVFGQPANPAASPKQTAPR